MKIQVFSALLLFLFFTHEQSFSQISNPGTSLNKLSSDDIWVQTLQGSYFNEFWTYHFYFENDLKVHITFSVANFGSLKSPVSGVQVSVDKINGNIYQLSREYSIEHLVQDKENHMFRNRIDRELYFEGKLPDQHRVRINTSKDGIQYNIDLNITEIAKGIKMGNGKYRVNSEEVGIFTHIPYAKASGYVDVDGTRKNVNGTVYMDHTFQNQTTTRLVDSGYRFVHHEDSKNWEVLYVLLPEDGNDRKTIGYHLSNRNGNIEIQGVKRIKQMSRRNLFGEDVARTLEIELTNSATIRLHRRSDTEKFSVLSELGRIARRAARTFLGGEVIHFRGEGVLMETGERSKRGYYNFFIVS
jgi:hypothetical protein